MMTGYLLFKYAFAPLFWILDRLIPKSSRLWAFAVHHIKGDQFVENQRAVFEHVKENPEIEKCIFTRTRNVTLNLDISQTPNTRILYLYSWEGLYALSRCKVVFLTHSVPMDYALRWAGGRFAFPHLYLSKRVIVNLWHATSYKKLLALTTPAVRVKTDRTRYRRKERRYYAGLIASSDVDRYAMAAMFHPVHPDHVWCTGLPRADFLFCPEPDLPAYIHEQVKQLKEIKGGKRLVTYAPTYRQTSATAGATYYQFSETEINHLKRLCRQHNLVFGFRMHYFRNDNCLFNMEQYVDNETIFDLGHQAFSEMAAISRETDLLITDYSSVFIEALCRHAPVFCFAYDLAHYQSEQDGLLYDFSISFPGPVANDFNALIAALEHELNNSSSQAESERYLIAKSLFYKHMDCHNAERVVARIENVLG